VLSAPKLSIRPLTVWIDNQGPNGRRRRQREMKIYSQFIRPGDLCFDVGANVGNMTDAYVKMGGRVVCVEPQDRCMRILKRRFGRNSDVVLVQKGLAERTGEQELWICDDNDAIATMSTQWMAAVTSSGRLQFHWARRQRVQVTTLDALVREFGVPVLCKIDVEGFELRVLKGLTQPIPCISFEFHQELIQEARECAHYIQRLGDVEFNYSTDSSLSLCLDTWLPLDEAFSRIEATEGPLLWGDIFARLR
jgi:FkbM family methyltransferase